MITAPEYDEIAQLDDYLQFVPYDVTRPLLYSAKDLYKGYDPNHPESQEECYDSHVYHHYLDTGKRAYGAKELLARSLHDFSMTKAVDEYVEKQGRQNFVGVMGGHGLMRTDAMYRQIVSISKRLTELGFTMITGGGPGAMEATHLGAWLASRSDEDMEKALEMLSAVPCFKSNDWLSSAFKVMDAFPQESGFTSLGVPTWLYGHEPATPFATHIAKYFENSIREDTILTLAFGGIIFSPGSAGTMQEVFQEAVQNHYLSFGFASPMVFIGKEFWTERMPVYPLLQSLMEKGEYKNLLLSLSDDEEEIVKTIVEFREKKKEEH